MSTPLEFSMKKPNTQRQESTIRARECQCQFWPSFAFHIDPQYEKLKVESLAQSSPADSDWLKSDSSSQNHVFKQKAS